MKRKTLLIATGIFSFLTQEAVADFGCMVNNIGIVYCAPAFGGIARNSIGQLECGFGNCTVNNIGSVECSRHPGGGAATDSIGSVKCRGGCVGGDSSLCEKGQ